MASRSRRFQVGHPPFWIRTDHQKRLSKSSIERTPLARARFNHQWVAPCKRTQVINVVFKKMYTKNRKKSAHIQNEKLLLLSREEVEEEFPFFIATEGICVETQRWSRVKGEPKYWYSLFQKFNFNWNKRSLVSAFSTTTIDSGGQQWNRRNFKNFTNEKNVWSILMGNDERVKEKKPPPCHRRHHHHDYSPT